MTDPYAQKIPTRFGMWSVERVVGVVAVVSATIGFVVGVIATNVF